MVVGSLVVVRVANCPCPGWPNRWPARWPGSGGTPRCCTRRPAWARWNLPSPWAWPGCARHTTRRGSRRPAAAAAVAGWSQSHGHPDLLVLMPEQLRREKAWPLVDDKIEGDEKGKRKPSRQIRIDETRSLVDWVYKTSPAGAARWRCCTRPRR
jgi:hypothetical protein